MRAYRGLLSTFIVVALAVCAFAVLSGSASQSRLEARATVNASARSAYDILVRPSGSQSAIEKATGRVRPNFLAGIYGGITPSQWRSVQRLPDVQVAAPIAMLGQVSQVAHVQVDVSDLVEGATPSIVRLARAIARRATE